MATEPSRSADTEFTEERPLIVFRAGLDSVLSLSELGVLCGKVFVGMEVCGP